MWSRIAPDAVANIERLRRAIGVSDDQLVCRLCNNKTVGNGLLEHFVSKSHVDRMVQTMQYIKNNDRVETGRGARVQRWYGQGGVMWFNHLTGEVGID